MTTGYGQVAIIFPFIVAAPRYFAKAIQLGGLMQIASAFGQVQDSLSFIVNSYTEIAEYQAVVQRLAGFRARMRRDRGRSGGRRSRSRSSAAAPASRSRRSISICRTGAAASRSSRLAASPGKPLLITGPSGIGKSTLLRAHRRVVAVRPRPHPGRRRHARCFCRSGPICRSARWRDALAYPRRRRRCRARAWPRRCAPSGSPHLVGRLDEDGNWAQRLSIGEQQRLAFARVLLTRPEIVFLDEATSALDEAGGDGALSAVARGAWQPTIVSVGHHGTLRRFHEAVVDLARAPVVAGEPSVNKVAPRMKPSDDERAE